MKSWISAATLLACLVAAGIFPIRTTTDAPSGLPQAEDSLLDLVPASALAAIELRDLDRRWAEIRSLGAIAELQDLMLSAVGIPPDRVPELAGERALIILLSTGSDSLVTPMLLLQPRDRGEALRILGGSPSLHYCDARGALWVGPAAASTEVERIARTPDPGLRSVLPVGEMDARLGGGGLVRGYLHPRALADLSARLEERTNFELPRWAASWLAVELSAVRYIAFRREITGTDIETEALAAYDLANLPVQVARIFTSDSPPVPDAPVLPQGTIAAVAFRPEAAAWIPWLRHLAAADPHGPMRNLGFQVDEFNRRYHRNLEQDLCTAIGERGWLFVLEGEQPGSASAVALLERRPSAALEGTLANVMDWAGEQIWVTSLGAFIPYSWTSMGSGVTAHNMEIWTILGRHTCLAFAVTDRHLVVATDEMALHKGLEIASTLPTQEAPGAYDAHASVRVRGPAVAKMFDFWSSLAGHPADRSIEAVSHFLADFEGARMELRHEKDALRFRGRARFTRRY